MNSQDRQSRLELVENLRNLYLGAGSSGGGPSGGRGTAKGAKRNPYIQFLREYKGVQKPHMAYKEHKKVYDLKGGRGTAKGAKRNPYIQFLREYKGVQKPHMAYKEHKKVYDLKGGRGTAKGAKRNPYIQFLREYKGVQKPHMAYKEHKKVYDLKGSALMGGTGTRAGAAKNNYIAYLKKYKGKKSRPAYDRTKNYLSKAATKKASKKKATPLVKTKGKKKAKAPFTEYVESLTAPKAAKAPKAKKSTGRKLNRKLQAFNKCVHRYRRDHPEVSFREAQQIVKANINWDTGECQDPRALLL